MKYTVSWSRPTRIPGYEPAYVACAGEAWERAYDFARALPPAVAAGREYELRPGFPELYTALRDGAARAQLEVWPHQTGIVLGRPFVPERLGTVVVTAAREA